MESGELLAIISRGEDSKHQFKANVTNINSLAAEMVAFSNSDGGQILVGVTDRGDITGLTSQDIRRLNQLVSNAATQSVRPPINPQTENIALPEGLVMVITVSAGISQPYMDNKGAIWVKSGADKRKVTAREELQRMYQSAGLVYADEVPVKGLTIADLDAAYFKQYFTKLYDEELDSQEVAIEPLLENMNLMRDGVFNLAGALLFAKNLPYRLPAFGVKAISYPGEDIHVSEYRDSEEITGKIETVFKKSLAFLTRNLRKIQKDQGVNSLGQLEIPKITLEELLTNALLHRDYFILAPIRLFIFDNRLEIINPGHLPNNLTIQNIKNGNSTIRNPILTSFATKILPYRGLGTGVRRALKAYPQIELIDDREGNLFTVIIHRLL